ncbi:MAG: HEAT repeat domain-containing protein, partial [Planctomycetota bacterium]|nr:HEAT repeat domain-containing protein [Planctomycetota bacterium]
RLRVKRIARRLAPVLGVLAAAGLLPGCGGGTDPEVDRVNRLREQKNAVALEQEVVAKDSRTSSAAIRALGQLGPQARPQIERAMKDPRSEVRREAAAVYPRTYSGPAAPVLATVARTDPDAAVRAVAVTSLGRMRALDEMETLLAAVEEPDLLVRQRASDAIALIMGARYDFSGTDEARHRTVAEARRTWREQSEILRRYYQTKPGPQSQSPSR